MYMCTCIYFMVLMYTCRVHVHVYVYMYTGILYRYMYMYVVYTYIHTQLKYWKMHDISCLMWLNNFLVVYMY
jgi:hypothetical protein